MGTDVVSDARFAAALERLPTLADRLGADRWHVSLTHDGGLAHAVALAERTTS